MNKKSPINYHWEFVKTDLDNVISEGDTFLDQCQYSISRQLKELEEIHRKSGALIHELDTVQSWLRGVNNECLPF